jgi:hypothetical protein
VLTNMVDSFDSVEYASAMYGTDAPAPEFDMIGKALE